MPITELRIEGLRTIEKVRLRLDGLTVLIGDNGTGKSSILEACEILRRATGPRFLDEFHGIHGGLTSLLRQGATRLQIGIEVRPSEDELEQYGFQSLHEYGAQAIAYNLIMISEGAFASIAENFRVQVDPGTKYRWTTGKRRRGLEAGWFEIGRRQGGEARSTEKGGQPEM
ncbi:MAG: AAA family ATPase, partial [Minicystis sp.]